jgi:hypothetical protein
MTMTITRSYNELRRIDTFEERFRYLSLKGSVGTSTFGYDRWLNQRFYTSREWKQLRDHVIVRDDGCDLGVPGYEIHDKILVHHMNPVIIDDILHGEESIMDPNFLVVTSHRTHNAIHYGDESLLPRKYTPRERGDTRLW